MSSLKTKVDFRAVVAEFVAMTFFVYVGCGSASLNDPSQPISQGGTIVDGNGKNVANPSWVLMIALQFGIAILVLVYTTAHISGGQINCAVTFALVLNGQVGVLQGLANTAAQLLGSMTGAAFLLATTRNDIDTVKPTDFTGDTLGSNGINPRFSNGNAFCAEFLMTSLLVWVVLETAVNKKSIAANCAPIAIGFAVFLAHVVLIPIDGCSINPTRSFGPAAVASMSGVSGLWDDMWLFWVAPLCGALVTAIVRGSFVVRSNKLLEEEEEEQNLRSNKLLEEEEEEQNFKEEKPESFGEEK